MYLMRLAAAIEMENMPVPGSPPRKRRVYIAGPITLGDTCVNTRHACIAFETLRQHGIVAFCPHWSMTQQLIIPLTLDQWLEYDFELIAMCDALLRLPGESKGADREVAEAKRLGIKVYTCMKKLLFKEDT